MIYLFGGEKGGAGKTTAALNFAVYLAEEHDKDVLIIDGDPQRSISKWHYTRRKNFPDTKSIECVQKLGNLQETAENMRSKYDDIIIDAGGRDSDELRSGLVAADYLYSPIRASQLDIWTLNDLVKLVSQASMFNKKLKANLFIALCPTNPMITEREEAIELLSEDEKYKIFNVMNHVLCERKPYRECIKTGKSVIEVKDKARNEFRLFAQEIMNEQ